MASAASKPLKVIIIGAGVTGLSLAHGLGKRNIPYEIYEKHPQGSRTRDWGITVHWAVEFLSLYPEEMEMKLRNAQVNPNRDYRNEEYAFFYNGETGDVLKRVPLGPAKRFSQYKVKMLLTEGIDVQYDKALKDYETTDDGVIVSFEDGTSTTGSLIVGCDGGSSYTRSLFFDDSSKSAWKPIPGYILNNFWVQYSADRAREIEAGVSAFLDVAVHPNSSYFGLVPLDMTDLERPETWKFQIFMGLKTHLTAEEDSSTKRFALVKEAGRHFCEPFRSAIDWLPEDTVFNLDRYGTWETIPWDSKDGRLLLAGDAAHSMTAHRAQGLNHALQDVLNIIEGLENVKNQTTTLDKFGCAYIKEVVDRGSEEVKMSLKQGMAVHDWAKVNDMPIMVLGTTPLHVEQSIVPRPV